MSEPEKAPPPPAPRPVIPDVRRAGSAKVRVPAVPSPARDEPLATLHKGLAPWPLGWEWLGKAWRLGRRKS